MWSSREVAESKGRVAVKVSVPTEKFQFKLYTTTVIIRTSFDFVWH